MLKIKIEGLQGTEQFAKSLASLLKAEDIVCLNGDLGAGKTTMTKSIGKALGVEDYITSPTFTLINEYEGRLPVYHFDVYRLEGAEDLFDLGFDEYFFGQGVCIIEWAEKIENLLPEDRIIINIKKTENPKDRIIEITGSGERYKEIIKELGK